MAATMAGPARSTRNRRPRPGIVSSIRWDTQEERGRGVGNNKGLYRRPRTQARGNLRNRGLGGVRARCWRGGALTATGPSPRPLAPQMLRRKSRRPRPLAPRRSARERPFRLTHPLCTRGIPRVAGPVQPTCHGLRGTAPWRRGRAGRRKCRHVAGMGMAPPARGGETQPAGGSPRADRATVRPSRDLSYPLRAGIFFSR